MQWVSRIEDFCFKLSNLWGLNRILVGILAFPMVLTWRVLYWISCDLYYLTGFCLLCTIFFATLLTFRSLPFEKIGILALPRLVGMMIALSFVRFKISNLGLIFILFHVALQCLRYAIEYYQLWPKMWGNLLWANQPSFPLQRLLEIWTLYLSAGICSNLFFQILRIFCLVF